MKASPFISKALLARALLACLPLSVAVFSFPGSWCTRGLYAQESGVGAPLGKLNVPAAKMAARCLTMVTPNYPQFDGESPKASMVMVRVVIWKSGNVSPMEAVSGPPPLQTEAMNTVRLWRYKPFTRDGEPLDVTTVVAVSFDPAKPGGVVTHPAHLSN